MMNKARMRRERMVIALKGASSVRNKSSGNTTMRLSAQPAEHFQKESSTSTKIDINETPSQHSLLLDERLRPRYQPVTSTAGEMITTTQHHKLPKIPPSIHTDDDNRGGGDVLPPSKKEKKRWRLPFPPSKKKGFGSSSPKPQTPSPTTSRATNASIPSKTKEVPPDQVYPNDRFEQQTAPPGEDTSSDEEASLLSCLKEEMEQQIEFDNQGWDRLERKLKARDETLKRLSKGKSEAYVEMLRHHEEAARQQKRNVYGQKLLARNGPPGGYPTTHQRDQSVATWSDNTGLLGEVHRLLLFEGYHSGQAVATILVSSTVGIALYTIMETGLQVVARLSAPYVNLHQFHALLIVFGLVIMRTTGYFWWWLQGDSYACVKFELHNRHQLGYWDARLFNYLYRSRTMTLATNCLDILGFYSLYIGVSYFYCMAMDVGLWDPLTVWFEHIEQEAASTSTSVLLEAAVVSPSVLEEESSEELDLCDGAIQTLVGASNPIRRFVASRLCETDDWNEFAIAFDVVVILAGAAVCNLVGSNMMPLLI